MRPSMFAEPPAGLDWAELLTLAEKLGVHVWRPDAAGRIVRVTTPPTDTSTPTRPASASPSAQLATRVPGWADGTSDRSTHRNHFES